MGKERDTMDRISLERDPEHKNTVNFADPIAALKAVA